MSYIISPWDNRDQELGGKGRALASLVRAGLPVPEWFVIAPSAYSAPPEETHAAIRQAAGRLAAGAHLLAVRSSALDEDGAEHSFAGQLESVLDVPAMEVMEAVQRVWASGFSERLRAYRQEHGLGEPRSAPAVIVQRMVRADSAGVAFSADPVSGNRTVAVVSAVQGLGESLVSGDADADTFGVDRKGQIIGRVLTGTTPILSDQQIVQIAQLARQAAEHFGVPQDIEWAIENGQLALLQARPVTSLRGMPDPKGELNLWDNSNIAESYGGITTPLTFSFARTAYEHVYREFCRLLGVSESVIASSDYVFCRMLGLIQGRIYYNLLSWYRLIAMLPGYRSNRAFMEQMMGVKEELSPELVAAIGAEFAGSTFQDRLRLWRAGWLLIQAHQVLPRTIADFYRRLDVALAEPDPPLALQRPEELAKAYRHLETQLLSRWDAPLVNDFLAMIFYGVLRQLVTKWCGDAEGTLQNGLVSAEGGIISAEPAKRMQAMAQQAARNPALAEVLRTAPVAECERALRSEPKLHQAYQDYLHKFGDRCLEELKLESLTLHDDPTLLLRSIGHLALRAHEQREGEISPEEDLRRQSETRAFTALRGQPLRSLIFRWVLAHARARVRDRENLRFERTRLFGRVRRLLLELGRRYVAEGLLDDPRDVFYLEVEEALKVAEGIASTQHLRGLAAARKAEFAAYAALPAPPDRFQTRGLVTASSIRTALSTAVLDGGGEGEVRSGIGCSPGQVRGVVRLIVDPRDAHLEPGSILVAERTDPGWIMLFPAAAGVLVERGSVLSHSAIVARELRIPAVVAVSGLTAWLKDGDEVEFDGATGVIRRLSNGEAHR